MSNPQKSAEPRFPGVTKIPQDLVGSPKLPQVVKLKDNTYLDGKQILLRAFKMAECSIDSWNAMKHEDRDMFVIEVLSSLDIADDTEKKSEDEKQPAPESTGEEKEEPGAGHGAEKEDTDDHAEEGANEDLTTMEHAAIFLDDAEAFLKRLQHENNTDSKALGETSRHLGSVVFHLRKALNK